MLELLSLMVGNIINHILFCNLNELCIFIIIILSNDCVVCMRSLILLIVVLLAIGRIHVGTLLGLGGRRVCGGVRVLCRFCGCVLRVISMVGVRIASRINMMLGLSTAQSSMSIEIYQQLKQLVKNSHVLVKYSFQLSFWESMLILKI